MIRIVLAFIVVAALIHFGITGWRAFNYFERWALTKSLIYSTIISLLAVAVLTVFVVLF